MIELEIVVENENVIASALSGLQAQIPYATSLAINATLNDAQDAIRRTLPGHFHLRRKEFIERTIYIGPKDRARKDRLIGTVRINPERDQLAKFEDGGEKRSTKGGKVGVPIFRERAPEIIVRKNDPLSIARLFQSIQQAQGKIRGRRRKGQPVPTFGRAFIVTNAKGTFILEHQRPGPGGNRVLYWFKDAVHIEPSLHFVQTAYNTALAVWDKNADEAIARAIATMR